MSEYPRQLPPLSPDLAKSSSEVYKLSLLQELGQKHPLARKAWEKVTTEGKSSLADVTLVPGNYMGFSASGREIRLGTAPLPYSLKSQILFDDKSFRYADEIMYRFSHEATHKFAVSTSEDTAQGQSLYEKLITIRKQYGKGLSALGSLEYYQGKGVEAQAREDLVELINMRLWNAEYFARYIKFLGKPEVREDLRRLGLTPLGESAKIYIAQDIERIIKART